MEEKAPSRIKEFFRYFGHGALISLCAVTVLALLFWAGFQVGQKSREQEQARLDHIAKTQFDIDRFPYPLTLCDKEAAILDITFLELNENHGYTGYLVFTLDRSNLTDDELYWLLNGHYYFQELSTLAHYHPVDGEMAEMEYLGARYNDLYIYFAWRTVLQRHSLKDCYVSAVVTYRPEYAEAEDKQKYSYLFYFTGEAYHSSTDCLTAGASSSLAEMLEDAAP